MLAIRIFLGLSALVWLPYGLYCFAQPGYLEQAAGIAAAGATATTELRAMYGGLQAALGALCLAGVLRPAIAPTALAALGVLTLGLGLARLGGIVLDGNVSSYTGVAVCFEWLSALLSAALLPRARRALAT